MRRRFIALTAMLVFFGSVAMAVNLRDVTFVTRDAGKVVFSHSAHIKQKPLANDCKVCHDSIFSIRKRVRFSMADMKNGKSCGACHNGTKAFSVTECVRCHRVREITYQVKSTGPTRFSHKQHLLGTPDCGTCHPKLFAAGPNKRQTMADMKNGKSCGACHNGRLAFGTDRCVSCHPVREIVYQVKATGPTHFSHTRHIKVQQCGDCHPRLYPVKRQNRQVSMAAMEKGASCGACHTGKQAFALNKCSSCHPTKELSFDVKDAGNVVFSHTLHGGLYRCGDCHAALFATRRSGSRVSMKKMENGLSCGACHDGKTAFGVKDKCEACHKI